MKIYLGDLKHSISQRSQVVPLNIATLASAINDNFGNKVSTKLFLCPQKLISEIKSNPPDAIALSNYCWNSRLSLRILRLAKEKKFPPRKIKSIYSKTKYFVDVDDKEDLDIASALLNMIKLKNESIYNI